MTEKNSNDATWSRRQLMQIDAEMRAGDEVVDQLAAFPDQVLSDFLSGDPVKVAAARAELARVAVDDPSLAEAWKTIQLVIDSGEVADASPPVPMPLFALSPGVPGEIHPESDPDVSYEESHRQLRAFRSWQQGRKDVRTAIAALVAEVDDERTVYRLNSLLQSKAITIEKRVAVDVSRESATVPSEDGDVTVVVGEDNNVSVYCSTDEGEAPPLVLLLPKSRSDRAFARVPDRSGLVAASGEDAVTFRAVPSGSYVAFIISGSVD